MVATCVKTITWHNFLLIRTIECNGCNACLDSKHLCRTSTPIKRVSNASIMKIGTGARLSNMKKRNLDIEKILAQKNKYQKVTDEDSDKIKKDAYLNTIAVDVNRTNHLAKINAEIAKIEKIWAMIQRKMPMINIPNIASDKIAVNKRDTKKTTLNQDELEMIKGIRWNNSLDSIGTLNALLKQLRAMWKRLIITRSNLTKGELGEKLVYDTMINLGLDGEKIRKNVYMLANDGIGKTSETDILFVNKRGVFIFEVKNWGAKGDVLVVTKDGICKNKNGYLFGNEYNQNKNPITQVSRHRRITENLLESKGLTSVNVYPIIVIANYDIEIINESPIKVIRPSLIDNAINTTDNSKEYSLDEQNKILAVIDNGTVKEPTFEIELIGKTENEISSIIDNIYKWYNDEFEWKEKVVRYIEKQIWIKKILWILGKGCLGVLAVVMLVLIFNYLPNTSSNSSDKKQDNKISNKEVKEQQSVTDETTASISEENSKLICNYVYDYIGTYAEPVLDDISAESKHLWASYPLHAENIQISKTVEVYNKDGHSWMIVYFEGDTIADSNYESVHIYGYFIGEDVAYKNDNLESKNLDYAFTISSFSVNNFNHSDIREIQGATGPVHLTMAE